MFKTALVTGGNGNLGRLVAQHFENVGTKVVTFDLPGTEGAHSNHRHAVVLGNIRDQDLLEHTIQTHKPDVVIHLAAQAGVRYSIENPRAYLESNIIGTFEFLEAADLIRPHTCCLHQLHLHMALI